MEDFAFLAPARLGLLVLPLALLAAYLLVAARRRRYALRFTTMEMLDEVAPDKPGWRRHLPAIGLVMAVAIATLAFARPVVAGETVESSKLVVLAIDTSISMKATDVPPSRIDAARDAAGAFLESVPEGVAVGLVAFDGSARQLIAPTTNLAAVERILDNSMTQQGLGEGTAIGEAVFVGIDAIEGAIAGGGDDAPESADSLGTIVLLSDVTPPWVVPTMKLPRQRAQPECPYTPSPSAPMRGSSTSLSWEECPCRSTRAPWRRSPKRPKVRH
jgi:Ca-activated chloride channel homolog